MEMKKQRKAEEWKASSEDNVKMQENPAGSLLVKTKPPKVSVVSSCSY